MFTKVLRNHGDTDDEIYDWMLLNNGRGLAEKRSSRHHQQQQQQQHQQQYQPVTARNVHQDDPYGRTQPPTTQLANHPQVADFDDVSRKKGFWQQFITFVTCGLFTCA